MLVQLSGPTSRQTTTAVDGSYSFTAIPLGTYTLQLFDTANRLRAQASGAALTSNGQVLPVNLIEAAILTSLAPSTATQGQTISVTVQGDSTSFTAGTQFNFGAGVAVNSATVSSSTSATVNITVSPIATIGSRTITATTNSEVATGTNLFSVAAGSASIASVNPNTGKQNTVGLQVSVTGNNTHFTQATPSVSLGSGISTTQVQVISDTSLTATVNDVSEITWTWVVLIPDPRLTDGVAWVKCVLL